VTRVSINSFLKRQPAPRIASAVLEVQAWRKTGVLPGNEFRNLADEAGFGDDYPVVESALLILAATRWAETIVNAHS
jgi:hypothetical protein